MTRALSSRGIARSSPTRSHGCCCAAIAAYGIFEGASPYGKVVEGVADVQATPDEELAAFGEAMYGGRLPDSWQIADAEMWAIFRYRVGAGAQGGQPQRDGRLRREGVPR